MLGDRHVHDSSTVVREDHEDEEQPEGDGWHDEQIRGHDLARVIREKRAPGL